MLIVVYDVNVLLSLVLHIQQFLTMLLIILGPIDY